jgi:hypothetical protein
MSNGRGGLEMVIFIYLNQLYLIINYNPEFHMISRRSNSNQAQAPKFVKTK